MAATYLDRILVAHREAAAADRRSLDALIEKAMAEEEPPRGFRAALAATQGMAVISEVKRRSPSKGALAPDLDPAELARAYAAGGASCLSVLTDADFFGGSPADLQRARAAVDLPVIRKDFTVSAHDVVDARLMGADAVLLIVAALDDRELQDFHDLAVELGLDALVETHDEPEVERALAVGAVLVGVNQRDLVTFEVDQRRALSVAAAIPAEVVSVAESGIGEPADLLPLAAVGYKAALIGESLVRSGDPTAAVAAMRAATLA
ncbi:MAG: indole-3-glycerol phosphate synthase TrpC [Acidimicrobiia bacterium]|nr:indole-3-glycerol phosphate synthase TrpC [Acidimicrobiia bacterium]